MLQKKHITALLLSLLSLLTMGFWTSCEKYNSESVGSTFFPSNSMVRLYTHPVYVEFSQEEARVWGPYTNEVEASVDGTHVTLHNSSDSLALFIYGYPATQDSTATTDCNIRIESDRNFALYINKLDICSQQQPVVQSVGQGTCYLVVPKGSKNRLYSVAAPAVIEHHGSLVLTGEGELSLINDAPYRRPIDNPVLPAALSVEGGLYCQSELKLSLSCPDGDAIRVSDGPMRSSQGTWMFDAGQNVISNLSDSIVLIAGTYTGVAREGKFFENALGTVIRQAKVEGISALASDILDTLILHYYYDSTFVTLQQHFDSITAQADSALNIAVKRNGSSIASFKPRYTVKSPWVVLTNPQLEYRDTLIVLTNRMK